MEGKYYKHLVGQKVYLSPFSLEDADYYTEWLNDFAVKITLNTISNVVTLEKEKEMLKKLSEGYHFAILDMGTDKLIGSIGLHNVNFINQTAEFGIFIGDKSFWSRGYGTEAAMLAVDYGFNILNLQHISLQAVSFNKRAIRVYEKVGFKQVGKLTGYWKICGQRFDVIIMELLAKDFQSSFIKKTLDDAQKEYKGTILDLNIRL